ncbi:MAG: hypothetical protein ACRD1T_20370, partial [Acidimicrobiia bacterium]
GDLEMILHIETNQAEIDPEDTEAGYPENHGWHFFRGVRLRPDGTVREMGEIMNFDYCNAKQVSCKSARRCRSRNFFMRQPSRR